MPEGDTVFQTARRLQVLSGQELTDSDFRVPSLATVDLSGRRVLETVSRGKHLLTRVEGDATVHTHLRMEGRWDVHAAGSRWRRPAHEARVVLRTPTHEAVGFAASRTAAATAPGTSGWNTEGTMKLGFSSSSVTTWAMAAAAPSSMSMLISWARASSRPRKTPGKASTLLIWLG